MADYTFNIYQKGDFTNTSLMNELFSGTTLTSEIRNKTFSLTGTPETVTIRDTDSGTAGGQFTPSNNTSQTVTSTTNSSLYPTGMGLSPVNEVHLSVGGQSYSIYLISSGNAGSIVGIAIPETLQTYLQNNPGATMTIASQGSISNDWDVTAPTYGSLAVCFADDALIDTDHGPVAAGDLVAGDMVATRDRGFQPIRWVGSRDYDSAELTAEPHLRPIRIRAGALGDGMPVGDLVVSPQHRVLVRSRIAQKMFGTDEVLVAAKQLVLVDGIDVADDLDSVTYVHFMFDDHQVVFANGAEAESLYTGPEALRAVGPAAREEILTIFPELREGAERPAARTLASGRMGRKLAMRHAVNSKPLVM